MTSISSINDINNLIYEKNALYKAIMNIIGHAVEDN